MPTLPIKVFVCVECAKEQEARMSDTIFGCFDDSSKYCCQCSDIKTCIRRLVSPQPQNAILAFCENHFLNMGA